MKKYLQKLDTLGLVLLVAAVIWYSVSNVWSTWNVALLILGGVLVIVGIAANYRQILDSFGKRSTKYASNYVISLILVIAIASGLNYIGQRHPKRIDMTKSGRYTLAPQTTQILGKLDKDLNVKAFFPGGEYAPLRDLLLEYRTASSRVHYEFIDPNKEPEIAKQNDVTVYGTVSNPFTGTQTKFGTLVITYGNRKEKIEKKGSEDVQEEDLTNAVIKVGRSEAKKIYFIQGHEEKDPSDSEQHGYSEAKKALESQGYKVETVNLVSQGKVPEDAKVVIEAGPKKEPFPQEEQLIKDFLNKGGRGFFLLIDPQTQPLDSILKDWGIKADNDVVLDISGVGRLFGVGPAIPLVRSYENHKITDRFKAMTFFPLTRSIKPENSIPSGATVETLFKSDPNSWGETDLKSQEASYDPGKDLKGPLSLAVAATREIKSSSENSPAVKSRMVVAGTSKFPENNYFPSQGNGNMFLNMVSWLAQDEDLISIRPKPPEDRRILLSQSQMAMLRLLTIFVLPGIALIAGIIVVWKRRRG
jgi:ABC-type uncharacterized transport system involved in gliding motility auxiliary subunit